jgi:hypothetical protein
MRDMCWCKERVQDCMHTSWCHTPQLPSPIHISTSHHQLPTNTTRLNNLRVLRHRNQREQALCPHVSLGPWFLHSRSPSVEFTQYPQRLSLCLDLCLKNALLETTSSCELNSCLTYKTAQHYHLLALWALPVPEKATYKF